MRLLDLTTIFLSLSSALANVEKVIFIPPPRPHPLQLTHAPSSLFRLSPGNPRLSTALDLGTNIIITSPSDGRGEAGSESWVVLEQLIPGKRYEVRIVWAATEPAEFELGVFTEVEAVEAGAGGGKVIRSEEVVEEEENSGEGERGVRARRRSSSETVMYLRILAIKDRYNPDPVTVELSMICLSKICDAVVNWRGCVISS